MEINLKLKCCGQRHCVVCAGAGVGGAVDREILVGQLVLLAFPELAAMAWSTVKGCMLAKK